MHEKGGKNVAHPRFAATLFISRIEPAVACIDLQITAMICRDLQKSAVAAKKKPRARVIALGAVKCRRVRR